MEHSAFWWEFAEKIGAPLFAATLVGCLLAGEFSLLHAILMAAGLGMMAARHWWEHHQDRGP